MNNKIELSADEVAFLRWFSSDKFDKYNSQFGCIIMCLQREFRLEKNECKELVDDLFKKGLINIDAIGSASTMTSIGAYGKRTTELGDKILGECK